jgi:hypothetical protein
MIVLLLKVTKQNYYNLRLILFCNAIPVFDLIVVE